MRPARRAPSRTREQQEPVVNVRCVLCNSRRSIKPGELGHNDYPTCRNCGMPMMPAGAAKVTR